jgi:BirA family biotin operon repressor/biotin-[acetyl-CoA-carboxylase] ligase
LLPATPIITIGAPLIELSEIDSTNIYAMSQIEQGIAYSGSCFRADFQTLGKGQHGRIWESAKGKNLLCTYILELKTLKNDKNWSPTDQKGFSAAIAIGVRAFFASYTSEVVHIKLPNDIYWNDRKAGGILIENKLRGNEWTWSVVGIGININQTEFTSEAGNPVSLQQITGKQYELAEMQQQLSNQLSIALSDWILEGETNTQQKLNSFLKEK